MPLCQYVRSHPEYTLLFKDHSVQERLLDKIIAWNRKACSGKDITEPVFRCQASCCMSLIHSAGKLRDAEWDRQRETVDGFVLSGMHRAMHGKEKACSYARSMASILHEISARARIYLVSSMDAGSIRNTRMAAFHDIHADTPWHRNSSVRMRRSLPCRMLWMYIQKNRRICEQGMTQ